MGAAPVVKQEIGTGGGVWRFDWCASASATGTEAGTGTGTGTGRILAACMYGGCKAFDIHLAAGTITLDQVAEYKGHASIAYGIAALTPPPQGRKTRETRDREKHGVEVDVVSCSFYDNQLHGWTYAA